MSKKRAGHKRKLPRIITMRGPIALTLALVSPLVACKREPRDAMGNATNASRPRPSGSAEPQQAGKPLAGAPRRARRAQPCPVFRPPSAQGRVTSNRLSEISGLAASNSQPLLWTHNDSGDAARVYAIDSEGKWLATHTLPAGIEAVDIEDMAVEARRDSADLVYLADTGDNFHRRYGGVYVHRFEEPRVAPGGSPERETIIPSVETMRVLYPDGPRDTETLIVDPQSGEMVFVSKSRFGYGNVYSAPRFSSRAEVEFVGSLTPDATDTVIPMVTGGDVSRDGRWLALRTYEGVYLFTRRPGMRLAEALLTTPCRLDAAAEQQGEAIALLGGENEPPTFLTISEGIGVSVYRSGPLERTTSDSFDLNRAP